MSLDTFVYPDKVVIQGPLVVQADVNGGTKGTLSTDNGAVVTDGAGKITSAKISSDGGALTTDGAGNLSAVGVTATGALSVSGVYSGGQQTGTVTTLSTGNTITPGTSGGNQSLRVTTAGAVTGIILAVGTKAGQEVTVIHEGAAANTITMAAAGTSNVADGVSDVITGPSARTFIWDAVTALWYKTA